MFIRKCTTSLLTALALVKNSRGVSRVVPKIENLGGCFNLAEGPHWDATRQCLYFVDIKAHSIFKYVPSTKKFTSAKIQNHSVSLIIPIKGKENEFIISMDREIAIIHWDGESNKVSIVDKIYEVDKNTNNAINDGKCDPSGRLWAGTLGHIPSNYNDMPEPSSALYSFQNNTAICHRSNVILSNGLAFDENLKKMYYIDSFKWRVDQYDFDIEKGTLSNLQTIFTPKHGRKDAVFDGMTIDTDGNLWIACFNESKVMKINPRIPETVLENIELPATQITSVAFGGTNMDELYVTTARLIPPFGPMDGALYRVTGLNARGYPGVEVIL